MPKKKTISARYQGAKDSTDQASHSCQAAGDHTRKDSLMSGAGNKSKCNPADVSDNLRSKTSSRLRLLDLDLAQQLGCHQEDPNEQCVMDTSKIYPDLVCITFPAGQMERCSFTAVDMRNRGEACAKAEYRNLYTRLMQTDRTGLKARYDSGDRAAAKQWRKFCDDTLTLAFLRVFLFGKGDDVKIQSAADESYCCYIKCMQAGGNHEMDDVINNLSKLADAPTMMVSEHEVQMLGKVVYVITDPSLSGVNDDAKEEVVASEVFENRDIVLDMSQWVNTSAKVAVANRHLQTCIAIMRKTYGADIRQAETTYQVILSEIRDVDAEQLADQAETGISDALDNYMQFQENCIQVAALWHMIYKKPIPLAPHLPEASINRDQRLYEQWVRKNSKLLPPHLAKQLDL